MTDSGSDFDLATRIGDFKPPKQVTDAALRFYAFWFATGGITAAFNEASSSELPGTADLPEEQRARLDAIARGLVDNGASPEDPDTLSKILVEPLGDRPLPEGTAQYVYGRLTQGSRFRFLLEILHSAFVNAYLTYLADLLTHIYRAKPEIMKSDKKISYKDALSVDSKDELVALLAEQLVADLSWDGLDQLEDRCFRSIGLDLFNSSEEAEKVKKYVAVRNLLVHRGGRIDRRFVAQMGGQFEDKIGQQLPFEPFFFVEAMNTLAESVQRLDARAADKFKLSQKVLLSK